MVSKALVSTAISGFALTALLLSSTSAFAQTSQPRAAVTIAGGYNSTYTPGGYPNPNSTSIGPFASVGLNIGDTIQAKRSVHTFSTHFSTYLPINQGFQLTQNPIRYSTAASYMGRWDLTGTLKGSLGGGAALAPLNTFNPALGPAAAQVAATPVGFSYNLVSQGTAGLTKQLWQKGTLSESEHVQVTSPIRTNPVRATVLNVASNLSYSQNYQLERLSLSAGSNYAHFGIAEAANGGVIDPRTAYLNHLVASWSHAWTPQLSSTVNGGVVNVVAETLNGTLFWGGSYGAQLRYSPQIGRAAFSYVHTAAVNAVTASVTMIDFVTLRGSLPLGKATDLYGTSTIGYGHTESINTTGALTSPIDVKLADVGLAYRPHQVPALAFALRYAIRDQIPTQNPTNETLQQIWTFSISYAYPNALFLVVDPDLPDDVEIGPPSETLTGEPPVGVDNPEDEPVDTQLPAEEQPPAKQKP